MTRKSWDEYFIKLVRAAADRGTCPRLKVGAVIVKNKRVLATGYNGSAPGAPHCIDVGCDMVNNHCVRTIHAEENAIKQLKRLERAGSSIYVTHTPCKKCAATIANSGIIEVVYDEPYKDDVIQHNLFEENGIVYRRLDIGQ